MSYRHASRLLLLETGGTIASRADGKSSKDYSNAEPIDTLLPGWSEMPGCSQVTVERVASVPSHDITPEIWRSLHERLSKAFASNTADAAIVTHGTDTLEETAFFLDLVTPRGRPVVITGAMRPSNAPNPDGPANLMGAVHVALHPSSQNRGVLVVFDDAVHAARMVYKAYTAQSDPFRSFPAGPLGRVTATGVRYFDGAKTSSAGPGCRVPADDAWPRVIILYAHVGLDARYVDAIASNDTAGIVLAGVGDGNAPESVFAALSAAVRRGIAVVRAARIATGIVDRSMEIDDEELGFVYARELNPHKSRILLQLTLASGITERTPIQRVFDQCSY